MPSLSLAISSREARVGAAEFAAAAKQASTAARDLDRDVRGLDNASGKAGSSLQMLEKKAAGLFTLYAAQRYVRSAIKEMSVFEEGIENVSTMLNAQTMHFIPEFREGITQLQIEFGEGAETLSKGLYDILSASIDASKALQVLEVSSRSAKAGLTTTAVSADVITTILNSYGWAAEEAEHVSDMLFATVLRGKTTFEQLATTVGQVASLSASAGLSFEEVGASLATMTRAGIATDMAVTSLKGILTTFLSPTEQNIEAAKKLGLELNSNTLRTIGLTGAMQQLNGANAETIAGMFSNVRALTGVSALLKQQEGHLKDLTIVTESAGAMNEAYGKIAEGTGTQIDRMNQALKVLKRESLEGMTPIIENITESVIAATPHIRRFFDVMNEGLTEGVPTLLQDLNIGIKKVALSWYELRSKLDKIGGSVAYDHDLNRIKELREQLEISQKVLDEWLIPSDGPFSEAELDAINASLQNVDVTMLQTTWDSNNLYDSIKAVADMEVKPDVNIPTAEFATALTNIEDKLRAVNTEIAQFGLESWEKELLKLAEANKQLKGDELASYFKKLGEFEEKNRELAGLKKKDEESEEAKKALEREEKRLELLQEEIDSLQLEQDLVGKSNEEREKAIAIAQAEHDLLSASSEKEKGLIETRKQEAIALAEVRAEHARLLEQKYKEEELERQKKAGREEAEELIRELQLEQEILFATDEERERAIKLQRLEATTKSLDANESKRLKEAYMAELKELQDLKKLEPILNAMEDGIGRAVNAPLEAVLEGTKSAGEALEDELRNIGKNMLRALYQEMVTTPLQNAAMAVVKGVMGFEDGAAFVNGRVHQFDSGTVVSEPTLFPMSDGAGVMAEKKPEAVMPLERDSQGRLGVISASSSPNVNVSANTKVVNVLDPSMMGEYLSTDDGERLVVNIMKKHKGAF